MIQTIPEEWRTVVCQCPTAFYDQTVSGYPRRIFWTDGTRLFTCSICNRPSSHCIYRCAVCSSVFLKDFSHPAWFHDHPRCWSCCKAATAVDLRVSKLLSGKTDPLVPPQLRKFYLSITEGFDADSFSFDFNFM